MLRVLWAGLGSIPESEGITCRMGLGEFVVRMSNSNIIMIVLLSSVFCSSSCRWRVAAGAAFLHVIGGIMT